jgi:hypothetical protein
LSYSILGQRISPRIAACVALIVSGFLVGVEGETEEAAAALKAAHGRAVDSHWSALGALFGIASAGFVATFGVLLSSSMPVVDGEPLKLFFYNNVNACLMFLPILLVDGELSVLVSNKALLTSQEFLVNGLLKARQILSFLIVVCHRLLAGWSFCVCYRHHYDPANKADISANPQRAGYSQERYSSHAVFLRLG